MADYQYSAEDIGNIVSLEHVNICIGDRQLDMTTFYVTGLGLTRDPYLNTGTANMWINVGRSQFHLPSRAPQRLRGTTGLVIPHRDKLLQRLESVREDLADTQFAFRANADHVAVTCPLGNQIRCHQPGEAFGIMQLGMPYVEFDVPPGTTDGIARFYERVMSVPASVSDDGGTAVARISAGEGQWLLFRETDADAPAFDGHHVCVYLVDFSGPYERLSQRGLISQEDSQHQYRFIDIVDPDDGRVLFKVEHEVRSMRHPLYDRPLVNRNPLLTQMHYVPGHEDLAWTSYSP